MDKKTRYVLVMIGCLTLLYLFIRFVIPFVFPFILGTVLALLLEPVVQQVKRRLRLSRSMATGVTIVSSIGLSVMLLIVLSSRIAVDVQAIISDLPVYTKTMLDTFKEWASRTQIVYGRLPQPVVQTAEESIGQLYNAAGAGLGRILASLTVVPTLILNLILSFIVAFFVGRDRTQLEAKVKQLLPARTITYVYRLAEEIKGNLVGFVWAQLILVTITTTITIIGLLLLRVRYALFIGIISGFLDIIPVVGPTLLFVPWIVITAFSGETGLAIGLIVVYLAMNVVRQLLQAKVIGSRTGLHPLAVLLSLYLGLRLFGPGGVIAGPLTLIIFSAVAKIGSPRNFT